VLDPGVNSVCIGEGGLQVPYALELPGVGSAVVPLVRSRYPIVGELIPDRLPGLAAVAGALHDLSEPAARLRCIDAVRVHGGALQVINLPAAEMGTAHIPCIPFAIGRQDKRAFFRPDEHPYFAHETSVWLGLHAGKHTRGIAVGSRLPIFPYCLSS